VIARDQKAGCGFSIMAITNYGNSPSRVCGWWVSLNFHRRLRKLYQTWKQQKGPLIF